MAYQRQPVPGVIAEHCAFLLPLANINAAAGHYGCEPADVQFSVALFYAGYAGFYSLEHRFFAYLAGKQYFILFMSLQMLGSLVCYFTHDLYILLPVRFVQGLLFCSTASLSFRLCLPACTASGRGK